MCFSAPKGCGALDLSGPHDHNDNATRKTQDDE
jgi:hypothetical protein